MASGKKKCQRRRNRSSPRRGADAGRSTVWKPLQWHFQQIEICGLAMCLAVNEVGGQQRSLKEVKKKWADLKLKSKKRLAQHKASVQTTGGGRGNTSLTPEDDRIGSIIGESAVMGVYAEGDTDLLSAADSDGTYVCYK